MLSTPRILLPLALLALRASCGSVQTQLCQESLGKGLLTWRSLYADLQRDGGQSDLLSLKIYQEYPDVSCAEAAANFSATLDLTMLGHRSKHQDTGSATCHARGASGQYLVYPMTFNLGSLPPLSTFDIRLQLESPEDQDLGCLQAVITPAMSNAMSATLLWAPLSTFIFVLLVGTLRGFNERVHSVVDGLKTSDLNLPGVGDFLSYLQFIFLSGGLSLQYPGFFQPVVSKLHLFSLFTTGPFRNGYSYSSVEDGIYAINGTYGGTTGLEHMHQIVGAPHTMITWYNFIVAFLIISAAAALFLELVGVCRRAFERKYSHVVQQPSSGKFSSRVLAVMRLVLSYFTLPLFALSFYQLSAAAFLPIYHTISATLLIIVSMLALAWLFRRLPAQSAGRLIHGVPKWYQKEMAQSTPFGHRQADKFFATTVVVVTFIRGAVIGGLQKYGPVQLAILATTELCFLVTIRWLQAYSIFTVGTIAPVYRLVVILLMICFVQGISQGPVKSAFGYTILALHASMLLFGFFLPAVYHFSQICRNVGMHLMGKSPATRPFERNGDIEHSLSSMALAPIQRDGRLTPAPPSSDGGGTPLRSDFLIGPTSPKYGYFREPRHSSMRSASGETKSLSVLSEPSNVSTAYDPGAASPPSSSQGGSVDDSWHDTRSMPLGPRWHDYTYREGDAFYGPAPTNEPLASTSGKAKAAPMSVTPTVKSHRSWNALGEAFGSVKQTIASSLSAEVKKPDASGFQVIRPPRQSSQLMPNPEPEAASAEDVDSISSE